MSMTEKFNRWSSRLTDEMTDVVSLADLWGEHSPLVACVEHARYIKGVARHGFGDRPGQIITRKLHMWRNILISLSHEKIRLEDKVQIAEWLSEINEMLGGM